MNKWQKRSFPFFRAYEKLCNEYKIIIEDNHIIDASKIYNEPEWFQYFAMFDDEVLNGPQSSGESAK